MENGQEGRLRRDFDNPVDHKLDLGLVNYVKHPNNPDYVVFRFGDQQRADDFQKLLEEGSIWFERDEEQSKQRTYHLFGIHKRDFKKVERLNYTVEAANRKPFIPFKGFRYFLILFSAIVMTLAMIGYCKAQQKLASYDDNSVLINPEE